jgi:hypothetical protein
VLHAAQQADQVEQFDLAAIDGYVKLEVHCLHNVGPDW